MAGAPLRITRLRGFHDVHYEAERSSEGAGRGYRLIREQIGRTIVGQDAIIRPLLASVFAEGHVLLIGVPLLAGTAIFAWAADTYFVMQRPPADTLGAVIP